MFNRTWLSALLLVSVALFACGQQDQPVAPAGYEIGDEIYTGGRSEEEMILASSVIVRANLTGMSTSTVQTTAEPGSSYWTPVLKFRFRVLEYLKGTGPTEIDALVTDGGYHDTQATARAQLPRMQAAHDTQWDDRQGDSVPRQRLGQHSEPVVVAVRARRYLAGRRVVLHDPHAPREGMASGGGDQLARRD